MKTSINASQLLRLIIASGPSNGGMLTNPHRHVKTRLLWLALTAAVSSPAADLAWTNTAGGDWNAAANWSPNQVPGPEDHASIIADGTYVVNLIGRTTVAGLQVGGSSGEQVLSNAAAATLQLTEGATVGANGRLVWNAGTLTPEGAGLSVQGRWFWQGGTLASGCSVTVNPDGEVQVSSDDDKLLMGAITNSGRIALSGKGRLVGYGGTWIENLADGLFDVQSDALLYRYSGGVFNNAGLFRNSAGTNVIVEMAFHNAGTLEARSGVVTLSQGGSISAGAQFLGTGTCLADGGTFTLNGAFYSENLVWGGATVTGTGTLSGSAGWPRGTFDSNLRLTVASDGQLHLSGSATKLFYGIITNQGLITLAGTGDLEFRNSARIENLAGAIFEIQGEATLDDYSGGTFNNAGLFLKSAGQGTNDCPVDFTNTGTVEVECGAVRFTSGRYDQTKGRLSFGLNSPTDYGRIVFAGAMPLTGELAAHLNGAYSPARGDSFNLLYYGSRTGEFVEFCLPPSHTWITNYGASAFSLTAESVLVPPVILTQPQGAAVMLGANVVLTVAAQGRPDIGYQWQRNGEPMAGATSTSLVLTNVGADQEGNHTVTVSDAGGTVTSHAAPVMLVGGTVWVKSLYDPTAPTRALVMAPDHGWLASAGDDQKIYLRRLSDDRVINDWPAHSAAVTHLALSPDGGTLASSSPDCTVRFWRVADGVRVRNHSGFPSEVTSIAFSPDDGLVAMLSQSPNTQVRIHRRSNGGFVQRLTNSLAASRVAFSADGTHLYQGGGNESGQGHLLVYRTSDWGVETNHALPALGEVQFSGDGVYFAFAAPDDSLRLHRTADHSQVWSKALSRGATNLTFSPDGTLLRVGHDDGNHYLFRVADGSIVWSAASAALCAAFSADATVLALGYNSDLELRESHTGGLLHSVPSLVSEPGLPQFWQAHDLSYSPDGSKLAACSRQGSPANPYYRCRLYNAATGSLIWTVNHANAPSHVEFSPDGESLAIAYYYGREPAELRRVSDGQEVRSFSNLECLAFSPDGGFLAGGGGASIRVTRVSNGATVRSWPNTTNIWDSVSAVAFAPDGVTLASGSDYGVVKLWDWQTATLRHTLPGHSSAMISVSFAPDGQCLVSGSVDGLVRLWRVADGATMWVKQRPYWLVKVAFAADGATLVAAWADGAVHILRASDGATLRESKQPGSVRSLAVAVNGRYAVGGSTSYEWLAAAHNPFAPEQMPPTLAVALRDVDIAAGTAATLAVTPYGTPPFLFQWQLFGTNLPSATNHSLEIANLPAWTTWPYSVEVCNSFGCLTSAGTVSVAGPPSIAFRLQPDPLGAHAVAWHDDASQGINQLIAGCADGALRFWDYETREVLRVMPAHTGSVAGVALTSDQATLASAGGEDGQVRLWNLADKSLCREWPAHDQVLSLAFNSNGTRLVTGGVDAPSANPTGKVKLWDASNGSLLWSSSAHGTATRTVSVSKFDWISANPSGPPDWIFRTWMASGGDDGLIRVWNINGNSPYGCFVTLSGHTGAVNSVAFSPWEVSRDRLASGGADGTVRHWDFDGSVPQQWMALTPGAIHSVTGTGNRVNSLGDDGWTRAWNVSSGASEGAWKSHANHGYANLYQRSNGYVVSGGDDEVFVSTADGYSKRYYDSRARPVLAVSPGEGGWAVVPRSDVRLSLVNILAGQEITSWLAHERPITCVAFSTVGEQFASGGEDRIVRVWDTTNSQAVGSLPATFTPQALAFTGLGETLVAGGSNQVVGWNVATTNARWTNTAASLVTDVAGSQFTSTVAIALTNGQIELRHSSSGALFRTLTHHTGCVNDLLITATGSQLISGSADGTIRFWDLATGSPQGMLVNPGGGTTALALSADDTTLAAASEDGFLRFWRLADGARLRTFGVETVGIADMAFAAASHCFLFVKADGELVIAYNPFIPLASADLRLFGLPVVTNAPFQFRLWTAEGVAYRLQASSNLSAWSDWKSFLGTQGWTTFTDPGSTNTANRFYRAVAP